MRVITGSCRGKKLKTLESLDTRPTTDMVKEAVFSIIQFDVCLLYTSPSPRDTR